MTFDLRGSWVYSDGLGAGNGDKNALNDYDSTSGSGSGEGCFSGISCSSGEQVVFCGDYSFSYGGGYGEGRGEGNTFGYAGGDKDE